MSVPQRDEKKETVSSFFTRASTIWEDNYTGNPGSYGVYFFAQRRERVLEALGPREGKRVLDVGCASGDLSFALATGGANVSAMDLTKEMVRRADKRRRDAPRGLEDAAARTRFLIGDAEKLPFADGSFDGATCVGAMEYVPDDAKGVRELFRILKPGGRLAITAPHGRSPVIWTELFIFGFVGLFKKREPGAFHRNYSEARMRKLLEEAGFKVNTIRYLSYLPYNVALRLPKARAIDGFLRRAFQGSPFEKLGVTMVIGAEKPAPTR